jgi:PAS domain S-box-containing protein
MAESRSDGSARSRPTAGSVLGRYAAALGIVLASGVLHRALTQAVGPLPPFLTLYPAVLFVALLAGGGPGVLAIGLSLLMAQHLRRAIAIPALDDVVAAGIFVVANLAVCALAERLRRDRRERLRAEEQLQAHFETAHAQKEWYSLVLSSMNDEVYFTDRERRYTYANHAVLREFGYNAEGVELEKIVSSLEVLRPDGTPRPIEEAPPLRSLKGEIVRDEEQLVRNPRTGELRHRLVSSAPVRDAAGEIIGAVSVVRDVTEQQRIERALREADHRKDVFLASLSHELRNPLAPIRTAAQILESADASRDDMRRSAAIISRQVAHMGALLDDLLDVSRFTHGELILERQHVPLHEVLAAAVEVAQPLLTARGHRLHLEPLRPAPVLDVDPVRLTQVISNLLTNAAKYTDPGGDVTLACRLDSEALVLFVSDTGIGIAPELHARIFEMFVQADPTRGYAEGGLGIGLALAKTIVEAHGGRIEVASATGDRGSTFTVTLPRSVVVAGGPAEDDSRRHAAPARAPRRVLVADDNPDGAASLGMLLEASGHEVHLAHDGTQALEVAARVRPHVALLDIGMPGLDGYQVAARIRRESWGGEMKLIAMTGWGQDADKLAARQAGFDHHLTKPVDPAKLDSLLREAARDAEGGSR